MRKIDPNKPKIKLPSGGKYIETKKTVEKFGLHTICQSGNCPNLAECWQAGTATFMILGDICTRSCKFCSVTTGKPFPPDSDEPQHIAESIKHMKLKHCVITSVDRDDLPDGGAEHWVKTILTIKQLNPLTTIEVLIPDFQGNTECLDKIIDSKPHIISHNLETVERLTPNVRSVAKYRRSLDVLSYISCHGITSKSGIMLGLGETLTEIGQTMDDILNSGCKIITIGQYLQPTPQNLPVTKYYAPSEFDEIGKMATSKGFHFVESSALVRSSYHAEKHVENNS
jgi:lipoic acid synthetase